MSLRIDLNICRTYRSYAEAATAKKREGGRPLSVTRLALGHPLPRPDHWPSPLQRRLQGVAAELGPPRPRSIPGSPLTISSSSPSPQSRRWWTPRGRESGFHWTPLVMHTVWVIKGIVWMASLVILSMFRVLHGEYRGFPRRGREFSEDWSPKLEDCGRGR